MSDSKHSVDFRIDHSCPMEVDENVNDQILRKMKINEKDLYVLHMKQLW